MEYLPTPEERKWLIARLAELIEARGAAHFVDRPLVLPTREFFPDSWSFDHEGLDRLVRRLLQYADLGDLDVRIDTFADMGRRCDLGAGRHRRAAAAVFLGIRDGCCLFGFNERAPADLAHTAGIMSHEVGHAYRARHALVADSTPHAEEECITDVTAAYLGFGILAANNSFRYRTSGGNVGVLAYHSWSAESSGYLPEQAFAYLLAAQLIARDLESRECARLIKRLEPNQAAFARAALKEIEQDEARVVDALGLDAARERTAIPPAEILRPLPAYVSDTVEAARDQPTPARFNAGRPVFRLARNRMQQQGAVGTFIGAAIGGVIAVLLRQPLLAGVGLALGATAGAFRGARRKFDVCCDPECGAVLAADETCPNCAGLIVGSIQRASDRLEAAEAWERRMKRKAAEDRSLRNRSVRTDVSTPDVG